VQIAVEHPQSCVWNVWILVEVIDAISVERRRAPDDAEDLVTLVKQKFG
jgi:hypothetical protein